MLRPPLQVHLPQCHTNGAGRADDDAVSITAKANGSLDNGGESAQKRLMGLLVDDRRRAWCELSVSHICCRPVLSYTKLDYDGQVSLHCGDVRSSYAWLFLSSHAGFYVRWLTIVHSQRLTAQPDVVARAVGNNKFTVTEGPAGNVDATPETNRDGPSVNMAALLR
jgi:hypothetical protein